VLFFKENSEHVTVDEAQIYPPLFATLSEVVDERRKCNGRPIYEPLARRQKKGIFYRDKL